MTTSHPAASDPAADGGSPLSPSEEMRTKHARLVTILQQESADALVLSSAGALSWLLCGARVHISLAGPPILRAVVTPKTIELAVFTNEAARIQQEELAGLIDDPLLQVHSVDWHANIDQLSTWLSPVPAVVLDESSAAVAVRRARAELLPVERERYRALCVDAASALTEVLTRVTSSTTERDVVAKLAAELIPRGADPVVLLAQGASRAVHRHPLPTDAPLGRRAMAVVCARRHGLIANVTRWVRFGEPAEGEEAIDAGILEVEADVFDALEDGAALESILDLLKESYPQHGFSAAEWTLHHQGGAAGYQGRDPRVSPGVVDLINSGQSFAFNPSAYDEVSDIGAKVEDTVIFDQDDQGHRSIDVLSVDPRWPTVTVRGRQRPDVLERAAT